MRILAVIVILCTLLCIGCNSEKSDYDAGIAAYERGHYEAALYDFDKRADQGDPVAQFCLGYMYKHGKGVKENSQTALDWYTKAAVQGHVPALNNRALMYGQQAMELRLSLEGKALARLREGKDVKTYIDAEGTRIIDNLEASVEDLRKGIDRDNPTKQYNSLVVYNLALLQIEIVKVFLRGDFKAATEWHENIVVALEFAAGQGYVPAQNRLATVYRRGLWGESPDREKAMEWYEKAANLNSPLAQYNLAEMMYESGEKESMVNSRKWYMKAAEQGYAPAQYRLGNLYINFAENAKDDKEKMEEHQREAVKWHTEAADQGNFSAQSFLSMMYGIGWGVPYNLETANRLSFEAAQGGDASAAHLLGDMFKAAQDDAESYYWYSLALKNKDTLKNTFGPAATEESMEDRIDDISKERENVGRKLSDKEKSRIQERVDNWKPKVLASVGTGFYVSKDHILTNAHVARWRKAPNKEWDEIRINFRFVEEKPDSVDWDVDLALLVDPSKEMDTFAKFRNDRVEVGEMIALFGYPMSHKLSYFGNATSGQVSGLVGAKYDGTRPDYELFSQNLFQHTAPQQGGNSGGPVFDLAGNVVGVAVSGLNKEDIENVSFAIKSNVVTEFLRKNSIEPALGDLPKQKVYLTDIYEDIYEEARKFTVPVWCYKNKGEDPLPVVEITINNLK